MATTYIKSYHVTAGLTIAQTMADRFDYGRNLKKTLDGELISAYMCDPNTAEAEFLLSKAKYLAITGREQKKGEDILFYQIRQSFPPGEIDAETALKIGYDFALRWTKGKHAFFVVSHVDRPHPHIHIYYNSTTLDCTRKFRDFRGSAWAVRRLSDRICLEYDLSVIIDPKQKSKGKFKHYGQWLGRDKPVTFQERLKAQIDTCLADKPLSINEFLQAMAMAGYEIKHRRGGGISFRAEGQERYTALRSSTLGEGYGQDEIIAVIKGRALPSGGSITERHKVSLVIDIQSRMKDGRGTAYERWAKVFNLKQMAAAVQYLQENNLMDYEDLEKKAITATDSFYNAADKLKKSESAMNHNAKLKAAIDDYAKTRFVFEEYKSKKYSNKFLAENEAEIAVYRAAQATIKELLQGAKLPKMDTLKAEWQTLIADKKSGYADYRAAQKDMREVITVKQNIDTLLDLTDRYKNKEMER